MFADLIQQASCTVWPHTQAAVDSCAGRALQIHIHPRVTSVLAASGSYSWDGVKFCVEEDQFCDTECEEDVQMELVLIGRTLQMHTASISGLTEFFEI